jgi:hypothetical protein
LLLSAIALFCCSALSADSSATPVSFTPPSAERTADSRSDAKPSVASLPDAPLPKSESSSTAIEPSSPEPFINGSAKPVVRGSYETARDRKIWYGLVAASHGAAAFDAYSTRRAVSTGYGTETDPFLRPFAHSYALYAATQVSPAVMDYIGHRMMTSNHPLLRRFWWIPQVGGASFSLVAGVHNYRLVP